MSDPSVNESKQGKAYDAVLMRRMLRYLRPYRWKVSLAVILLTLSSAFGLAGPYLVKVGIDEGILAGNLPVLGFVSILYVLFLLVDYAAAYLQSLTVAVIGQRFMLDIRRDLFRHMSRLSLRFYESNPVGRLVTRVTGDVESINEMFTGGLVAVIGDILMLAGITIFLFVLNVKMALVTISVLPIIALFTVYFRTRLRKNFREVREKIAAINSFLQERISGVSVIQIFTQEEKTARDYEVLNREHTRAHLDSVFNFAIFWPLVEFSASLSVALILFYGGSRFIEGDPSMSLGALAAFIQYARRFFQPISDLSEKFNIMQAAMAAAERIFGILDSRSEILIPPQPRELSTCSGELHFENISFHYEAGKPVLSNLNFRLEAGQRTALVGLTGSGKTTILNLLLRFHDPVEGRVLLDGRDLRDLDPHSFRRHFALVQQEVFLFPGTVLDNILLGDPAISRERGLMAAHSVGADRFVLELPDAYDTLLSERGGGLSTGQKQLIAFARALSRDPAFLVLDEATSSVDSESEEWIQRGLEVLMKDRSSLTVAHRLSTILGSDRILVLHQGGLQEDGSHETLLKNQGLYRDLYRLQFQDQEELLE